MEDKSNREKPFFTNQIDQKKKKKRMIWPVDRNYEKWQAISGLLCNIGQIT